MNHRLGTFIVMRPENGAEHERRPMPLDDFLDPAFQSTRGLAEDRGASLAGSMVEPAKRSAPLGASRAVKRS